MNAKEAVSRRIQALCAERDMAINALANRCGVAPSTIYSMLNTKSKNPGVVSIQKICDGLEISLREFLTPQFLMIWTGDKMISTGRAQFRARPVCAFITRRSKGVAPASGIWYNQVKKGAYGKKLPCCERFCRRRGYYK